MAKKSKYGSDQIEILEDLEHVRLRPSQYVGDTGVDGLHQLLKEVIDNAVDEYIDGHVTAIGVRLNTQTQTVTVMDNGRGIPIEQHKKAKIPTITAIFTKLHSGGKFGKGAYASATGGLHGVGVKATNALSEKLTVWTVQQNKTYTQTFEKGEATSKVVLSKKKLSKGTVVQFTPDFSIFKDVVFDPKRIRAFLRDISFLCPNLNIEFKKDDKELERFYSPNGILDMLTEMQAGAAILHEIPIVIKTDLIEAVFCWTDRVGNEVWKSYVNVVPTPEHGTHVNGIKQAIQQILSSYVDKQYRVRGEDLRYGLFGVVHAHVKEPEFRGQTKTKLGNREVEIAVIKEAEQAMRRFVAANEAAVKIIVEQSVELAQARKKTQAQQKAIRAAKVKQGARGILPGKLCEAPDCTPDIRELYIVEGASAFGTVKDARILTGKKDSSVHFQEVFPLRGKVLNAARKRGIGEVLKNAELSGITQAIGTGIGPAFDINKCRYSKIYLLMDADPDGRHILALLLAFFAKHMHQLIEEDKIRVVMNPLYMGVSAKRRVYGNTPEDINYQMKNEKYRLTRFKGLGESDARDLRAYAMEPKTRQVCRVTWSGDQDCDLVIQYMGMDSTARKIILNIVE